MLKRYIGVLGLLSSLIYPVSNYAQDLNLFQATDNPEERETNTRRPQRSAERNLKPAFTLVGTSRFGNEYSASLKNRAGESVRVHWEQGKIVPIKGNDGFAIADIGSRSVSIRVPESDPCIDSSENGIKCNGNIALLTLSNATPVVLDNTVNTDSEENMDSNEAEGNAADGEAVTIGNSNTLIRNPFSGELQSAPDLTPEEIAAREERRQRRAEQFRNFEIVRIPDDEIPEGQRRIRTPFGDSLEPIED